LLEQPFSTSSIQKIKNNKRNRKTWNQVPLASLKIGI
jgi:hypothetical protein